MVTFTHCLGFHTLAISSCKIIKSNLNLNWFRQSGEGALAAAHSTCISLAKSEPYFLREADFRGVDTKTKLTALISKDIRESSFCRQIRVGVENTLPRVPYDSMVTDP